MKNLITAFCLISITFLITFFASKQFVKQYQQPVISQSDSLEMEKAKSEYFEKQDSILKSR